MRSARRRRRKHRLLSHRRGGDSRRSRAGAADGDGSGGARTGARSLLRQLRVVPWLRSARRRDRPQPASVGGDPRRPGRRAAASHRARRTARARHAAAPGSHRGADQRHRHVPPNAAHLGTGSGAQPAAPRSWSATRRREQTYFAATCANCHSPTGDLKGIATRYADPRQLQQVWLAGTAAGGRGAPPGARPKPVIITVTLPTGQTFEGAQARLDDFIVSIDVRTVRRERSRDRVTCRSSRSRIRCKPIATSCRPTRIATSTT